MTQRVYSVSCVEIAVVKTDPLGLSIHVEGDVSTPGWTGFALNHYVYVNPPADGIYEADMVAVPPPGGIQVITPFTYDETLAPFPEAHLKGLKVYSGTNSVTAMLP